MNSVPKLEQSSLVPYPHILHMVLIWSDVPVSARKLGWASAGTPAEDTTLDNVHPVLHNLGITETEFTVWEVLNAKKQISQCKAPGEPEVLKRCDIDDRRYRLTHR